MTNFKQKVIDFFNKLKDVKFENLFLFFMIPIGLAYLFIVLPLQVPDELAHIRRSYNVSNLQIIERKNEKRRSNNRGTKRTY